MVVLLALIVLGAVAGGALAAGEQLRRSAALSGGGRLENGGVVLQSAMGQPLAGIVAQGNVKLCAGVLCGEQVRQVYLPVMHR